MEELNAQYIPSMQFVDWVGKGCLRSSVITSYKLDCKFRHILAWLQSQIPSLEFETINSIQVHLLLDSIKRIMAGVDSNRFQQNMRHQPQKGFQGISVGIPKHQKGYLICVPST